MSALLATAALLLSPPAEAPAPSLDDARALEPSSPASADPIEPEPEPPPRHASIARSLHERTAVLGPLGGVGLGLVGGGLTLAGTVLVVSYRVEWPPDAVVDDAPLPRGHTWVSWTPPVIAAGLATAALGVAMLTVDLTVFAHRRRAQTLQLLIDVSGDRAGLKLFGRF